MPRIAQAVILALALIPTFAFAGDVANTMCKGFDPVKDAPRICSDSDIPKGTCKSDGVCEAQEVKTESGGETAPKQATPGESSGSSGGTPTVTADQGTPANTTGSSGSGQTIPVGIVSENQAPPATQQPPRLDTQTSQLLPQAANQAGLLPGQSLLQQSVQSLLDPASGQSIGTMPTADNSAYTYPTSSNIPAGQSPWNPGVTFDSSGGFTSTSGYTFSQLNGVGTITSDPSVVSPEQWQTQVTTLAQNAASYGCAPACFIVNNPQAQSAQLFADSSGEFKGAAVIEANPNAVAGTSFMSVITGTPSTAAIATTLQNGVSVTLPDGTVQQYVFTPQAAAAIAPALASASGGNQTNFFDRAYDYVTGASPVEVASIAPTPVTPPQDTSVPPAQAPSATNVEIVTAEQFNQMYPNAQTPPNLNSINANQVVQSSFSALEQPQSSPAPQTASTQSAGQSQGEPQAQSSNASGNSLIAEAPPLQLQEQVAPLEQPGSSDQSNTNSSNSGGQADNGNGSSGTGATGGNPSNSGGSSNDSGVLSFLSGLLGGLSGPSGSAPASSSGSPQAAPAIVVAQNQPIVSIPATEEGLLGPCATQTQANGQTVNPCGATSNTSTPSGTQIAMNLPLAKLLNSLPGSVSGTNGSGSSSGKASDQNNLTTIIPGTGQAQGSGTSASNGQAPGSGTQGTSGTQPAQSAQTTGTKTSGSSGTGTANGNAASSASNPAGTQPGPTGTPNPAGSQQGGTGNPASTPGNAAGTGNGNGSQAGTQGPSGAAQCNTSCKIVSALDKFFGFFGPSSANAGEGPLQAAQNALAEFKRGAAAFEQVYNAQKSKNPNITNYDVWANSDWTQGPLIRGMKPALASFTDAAQALIQNPNIPSGARQNLQGVLNDIAAATQDASSRAADSIPGVRATIAKVQNALVEVTRPTIGPIGKVPTNQPAVVPIANNSVSQPNPNPVLNPNQNNLAPPAAPAGTTTAPPAAGPAAPAPATKPTFTAKASPINGAASVYDCRLGGINGNCAQSGTGGFVSPSEYSAALQTNLAKTFQTGTGSGNNGYALVKNLDTGAQMVVKVNDNGPLEPGRVIDFSPATMNCLGYGICNNDSTLRSTVLPNVEVTLLQGDYVTGPVENGQVVPATCGYKGCASPVPNDQVAAARVPGLASLPSGTTPPAGAKTMSDPTTGASFSCAGDAASCVTAFQQQAALSRLCASNPATCSSTMGTFTEKSNGTATPVPEPRKIITMQNAYGVTGKLAKNPNVPTISGVSSQQQISGLQAVGVKVQDMSPSSLSNYPHGKTQGTTVTWHGSGTPGADSGLVQQEINANNAGSPAAQAVLLRDGTLVVVAPLDAVSFHAATTNSAGLGIEIQGLANNGDNPTPEQLDAMQKITSYYMDQLGWMAGTHGVIEPGHKDAEEAGPATIAYVYQGVAPGPVPTYTLADANGAPVLGPDGNPVTTTQAPKADGTSTFLTNPDGSIQLDSNGKPIPLNPVPLTQDPTDPNKYVAPDDRPEQPKPANPWRPGSNGNPLLTAAPVAQSAQVAQSSPQQAAAQQSQPPQQAVAQPIPQPLPQPITSTTATSTATSTLPVGVVTLVANPTSVKSGGTSQISWSSVGTIGCKVTLPGGMQIGSTTPSGSARSPQLTATTIFTALCQEPASSATVTATTSVTVQ